MKIVRGGEDKRMVNPCIEFNSKPICQLKRKEYNHRCAWVSVLLKYTNFFL